MNRLTLRFLKIKARRSGNKKALKAIDKLIKDRELMSLFNDYMATELYGSPLGILDWLMENWEEILAMILKLIDIFSEDE